MRLDSIRALLAVVLFGGAAHEAFSQPMPLLPRIHGGKIVDSREAARSPAVKVEFLVKGHIVAFCAATVMDERTLLTAAHCTRGEAWDAVRIIRGYLEDVVASPQIKILAHPQYVGKKEGQEIWAESDLAVLRLPEVTLLRGPRATLADAAPTTKLTVRLYGYSDMGTSLFQLASEDMVSAMRTLRVAENPVVSTVRSFDLGYTVDSQRGQVRGLADYGMDIFMTEGLTSGGSPPRLPLGVGVPGDSGGPAFNPEGALVGVYSQRVILLLDNGEKRYFSIYVDVTAPRNRHFIESALRRD